MSGPDFRVQLTRPHLLRQPELAEHDHALTYSLLKSLSLSLKARTTVCSQASFLLCCILSKLGSTNKLIVTVNVGHISSSTNGKVPVLLLSEV